MSLIKSGQQLKQVKEIIYKKDKKYVQVLICTYYIVGSIPVVSNQYCDRIFLNSAFSSSDIPTVSDPNET